jgi:hypothetical protein
MLSCVNTLQVRLLNRHSISFTGKLYFRPEEYVQIDKDGFMIPHEEYSF